MITNKPTVSIILPTWNRSYIIKNSIDSVLMQTYENWELIIIDDNSSDNTEQIVSSYGDKRIKYLKSNVNCGAAESRNKGIRLAKGKYISFLDSDNVISKDKIEHQVHDLEISTYDMVFCGMKLVMESGGVSYHPAKEQNITNHRSEIIKGNYIDTSSVMIKSDVLKKSGGFDARFPPVEDWELFIRLIYTEGISVLYQKEYNVVNYRQENSISNNISKSLEARAMLYHKYKDLFSDNEKKNSIMMLMSRESCFSPDKFLARLNNLSINNYFVNDICEMAFELFLKEKEKKVLSIYRFLKKNDVNMCDFFMLFFDENQKIALYGLGKRGDELFEDLRKCPINIPYGIDKSKDMFHEVPIIRPDESYPSVDYIIVTVADVFENIRREIECKYSGKVITEIELLEKIIELYFRGN